MSPESDKITFKVEGMSCNHCKQSIESAVKAINGVIGAHADLEQDQVEVTFDSQTVKKEELQSAITGAGYRVLK